MQRYENGTGVPFEKNKVKEMKKGTSVPFS